MKYLNGNIRERPLASKIFFASKFGKKAERLKYCLKNLFILIHVKDQLKRHILSFIFL